MENDFEEIISSANNVPVIADNAGLRELLSSSTDENDIIIAINDYVINLLKRRGDIKKLTEQQKNFYLNQVFEMEMNNGGISQYFFNTSGQYAHQTVNSLKAVGAEKTADILQKAIDKFPKKTVPEDYNKRADILENLEDKNDEIWDKFDDRFYEYAENLNELNLNYVRQNIDDF
jgi:hypothetical protein